MQLYPEKYCKILIPYCNYDSSIIFYKNNYKCVILLSHNKNKLDFIHIIEYILDKNKLQFQICVDFTTIL